VPGEVGADEDGGAEAVAAELVSTKTVGAEAGAAEDGGGGSCSRRVAGADEGGAEVVAAELVPTKTVGEEAVAAELLAPTTNTARDLAPASCRPRQQEHPSGTPPNASGVSRCRSLRGNMGSTS
jgi:hypothetical protein